MKKNNNKWREEVIKNAIKMINNNRIEIDTDSFINYYNIKSKYIYGVEYREIILMYQDNINYGIKANLLGLLFNSLILSTGASWRYRLDIRNKLTNRDPELFVLKQIFNDEQFKKLIFLTSKDINNINKTSFTNRQKNKMVKFIINNDDNKQYYLNILNNLLKNKGNFDLH